MKFKKIEIKLLTLEKEALEEEVETLKKENEELKGFKEGYLRLYSDLYDLQSYSVECLPVSVQALVENYGMNYKYLNPDF